MEQLRIACSAAAKRLAGKGTWYMPRRSIVGSPEAQFSTASSIGNAPPLYCPVYYYLRSLSVLSVLRGPSCKRPCLQLCVHYLHADVIKVRLQLARNKLAAGAKPPGMVRKGAVC